MCEVLLEVIMESEENKTLHVGATGNASGLLKILSGFSNSFIYSTAWQSAAEGMALVVYPGIDTRANTI